MTLEIFLDKDLIRSGVHDIGHVADGKHSRDLIAVPFWMSEFRAIAVDMRNFQGDIILDFSHLLVVPQKDVNRGLIIRSVLRPHRHIHHERHGVYTIAAMAVQLFTLL